MLWSRLAAARREHAAGSACRETRLRIMQQPGFMRIQSKGAENQEAEVEYSFPGSCFLTHGSKLGRRLLIPHSFSICAAAPFSCGFCNGHAALLPDRRYEASNLPCVPGICPLYSAYTQHRLQRHPYQKNALSSQALPCPALFSLFRRSSAPASVLSSILRKSRLSPDLTDRLKLVCAGCFLAI